MLGISYCLRKGVTILSKQGRWFLLSRFPLKALALSPSLGPILARAANHKRLDPLEMVMEFGREQAERLDRYLYQLVKRGFLEEASDGALNDQEKLPRVSVIIPVRNRPQDLARCLASLKRVIYPAGLMEIMVVDDASSDQTLEVAQSFGAATIINKNRQGASRCRNLAAAQAKGDMLCFVDSDCTVQPDWLMELMRVMKDPVVTACGGLVDSSLAASALDRYERVMSSLRMGDRPNDSRLSDAFFYLPSCNLCVRSDAFRELGGFNESMEVGEDVDLCWRIIDSNGIVEYRPAAVVYHRHRNKVRAFCGRRFDYGTSEPLLQAMHPKRKKRMPLRPALLIFWGAVAAALTWHPAFWAAAAGSIALGGWRRRDKACQEGLPLSWPLALAAALRVQISGLHELASFVSRYYLFPMTLLAPLLPLAAAVVWLAHLGVGLGRFLIKKPNLDLPRFLFFFSLEQLAYQTGVWFQCVKSSFFRPVFPSLIWPGARDVWNFLKNEKAVNRGGPPEGTKFEQRGGHTAA